jgi:presequence protease
MANQNQSSTPDHRPGENILDYHIKRVVELKSTSGTLYELEHRPTGARHIHLATDDPENAFSVAFKTVPNDSSGVAHILEHTALCGSRQYPVRDPFFSMLKRSLSTFMNAFTASDWTMYPFCTQNRKDFYNLAGVYLDAAFFPNIDELSFKQEGHRLELEGDESGQKLEYKGVVYNEMKGAMSSPDQVLGRSLLNALYPDTTYRHNSGGEPADIPNLTHEQLKAFHARHYHPSNAYFYTYGNLPLQGHLEYIQSHVLQHFSHIDPGTDVPNQPRWEQHREVTYTYPLTDTQNIDRKYQSCVAWLTADIRDTFEILVLTVLEQVLLGNAASPLRKALMDSELGTALSDGSGFDADNRDTMFACGLKDVTSEAAQKIEKIVFDTIENLSNGGIDPDLIESAIHQIEFHRKEVTNTPYPYGLKLLLSFAGTWIHGGDPARILNLDADLDRLKARLKNIGFLEERTRRYFLDNPHRVLFTLAPDSEKSAREIEQTRAELQKILASLSPERITKIEEDARALKQLQEHPEDISILPTLQREDIPPDIKRISADAAAKSDAVTYYRQPTAGIVYLTAAAGVDTLAGDEISLMPFFGYALPKIGTAVRDYTQMARRIDRYTGGVNLAPVARTQFQESGDLAPFLLIAGKSLTRKQDTLFDIVEELTLRPAFTDLNRLKHLLLEYRAGLEAMVVQNGHRLAISLAARNLSSAAALSETWQGVHQLKFIKDTTADLGEEALANLAEKLSGIAAKLFSENNLKFALIGEEPASSAKSAAFEKLTAALGKSGPATFHAPALPVDSDVPNEGWATSTSVSFVACAFKSVRMEHPDAPALTVIAKMLRSLYLHREIREKGGAYGGFALYHAENGIFSMASYRDPHIVDTLKAFQGATAFIRSGEYTDEDVKEAILQVCSDIDKPDAPGQAARKAFLRSLISLTDDKRKRFKERLLVLHKKEILEIAQKYFPQNGPAPGIAVISNEEKIRAANERRADNPLHLKTI